MGREKVQNRISLGATFGVSSFGLFFVCLLETIRMPWNLCCLQITIFFCFLVIIKVSCTRRGLDFQTVIICVKIQVEQSGWDRQNKPLVVCDTSPVQILQKRVSL